VGETDSKVIQDLERKVKANEDRIEDLMRALYGHPALGQRGFRQEIEGEIATLRGDVHATKQLCEDLRQERRDELAERRGIKRVLGYSGATNLLTLLTLVSLIIMLWQGVFGGP
jgi:hypothetical protein